MHDRPDTPDAAAAVTDVIERAHASITATLTAACARGDDPAQAAEQAMALALAGADDAIRLAQDVVRRHS